MIRAVLFDAVGTLFHSRGTIGEIYGNVAANYDFHSDPDAIDQEFLHLVKARGIPVDKAGWKSLVGSVFANLGPFPRFDDFFEEIYEVFRTEQGWHCYRETVPVLETLKQSHYRLGVVSNFDSRLNGVLDDLRIRPYFEAIVTPDSSGHAKPDTRIFLNATDRLGVTPPEALFVGDDLRQDVQGAARAGLDSILVDRQMPDSPGDGASIRTLEGILGILGVGQ